MMDQKQQQLQQLHQQLEYRLATPADKEQVLRCHGDAPGTIYQGLDYVPERYDAAIASWNKVCGLCFDRSANLVIGYGQIFVFDNNRHMLLTALRVHTQYQGRGIATHLRNFLCQETRKKFPNVTPEVRFGVYKPEFSRAAFYAANPDYELISKRHYYLTEFPLAQLSKLRQGMSQAAAAASAGSLEWMDRRCLYSAMLADSGFQRLYRGSAISLGFEVMELDEANSSILPGDGDDAPSALVANGNDLTLGFGSTFHCLRGLRLDIDLFSNSLERDDFSRDNLADTSAGLVVRILDRQLAILHDRSLADMPAGSSLSLFVSLDCLSRDCCECAADRCDLEHRLVDRLRVLLGEGEGEGDGEAGGVARLRHPFYSKGCPYALVKRRLAL